MNAGTIAGITVASIACVKGTTCVCWCLTELAKYQLGKGQARIQAPPTAPRIHPPVRNDARVDESDKAGRALAHRTVSRDGSPRTGSDTPSAPPPDHGPTSPRAAPSAPPPDQLPTSPRVAPTTPHCTPPYPIQSSRRVPSPPPYVLFERGAGPSSHAAGAEGVEAPITTQPAATAIRV